MPYFPAPRAEAQAVIREHLSTFPSVLKEFEQEMLHRFVTDVASLGTVIVLSYVNNNVTLPCNHLFDGQWGIRTSPKR